MLTVYVLPSNTSSRHAKAHLVEKGIPFVIRDMNQHPLTLHELHEILRHTEEVSEIIAESKPKEYLESEGVDFEEITLSELHYYATKYPRLIKAPITIGGNKMVIGYDDDRFEIFQPREQRMALYGKHLEIIRKKEDKKLEEGKILRKGHWERAI